VATCGNLGTKISAQTSLESNEIPKTIPSLQQWTRGNSADNFNFTSNCHIILDSDYASQLQTTGTVFAEDLLSLTGYTIPVVNSKSSNIGDIFITLNSTDTSIGTEGYIMEVTADKIAINASTDAGAFYGTRTILQLIKQSKSIPSGNAKDWPAYKERSSMIDVARKYFTINWLENHIRELSYLKYNFLQLHLTDNEGFRIECASYPEIVSSQYHYTKAELTNLIAFAAKYHITIIPEIEMPSHLAGVLASHPELQLKDSSGVASYGRIDLSLPATYTFLQNILEEYIPLFPGMYFHTGTDEYLADSEYVKFPQLLSYAKTNYGENAIAKDTFYGLINWLDGIVKNGGKTLRVWNDGIGASTVVPINNDIVVDIWLIPTKAYNPKQFIDKGFNIGNSNTSKLYYVLGIDWASTNPYDLYENFESNIFVGNINVASNEPHNLGAKLQLWCDKADAQTESQIEVSLEAVYRSLAQKNWGSPRIVPTYDNFKIIMNAVGNAPGFTGHIINFNVYENLSFGKIASASSENNKTTWVANKAIDGDLATRWSSVDTAHSTGTEWYQVDLGEIYNINEVTLIWEAAYAKSYQLQVSDDAKAWETIYSTTSGNGGTDEVKDLSSKGRYVRMNGTELGTIFGLSIFEFKVFGSALGSNATSNEISETNTLTTSGTVTNSVENKITNKNYLNIIISAIFLAVYTKKIKFRGKQ